mmetsp:Transcript_41863/g.77510  ORF Transcript_41863/g.77510 Transcript_41863/m.77510 type:complete len:204 (+) Transcript_41863:1009-1620(+)
MSDERSALGQSVPDADVDAAQFVERLESSRQRRSARDYGPDAAAESVLDLRPDELVPHGVDRSEGGADGPAGGPLGGVGDLVSDHESLRDLLVRLGQRSGRREELDEGLDGGAAGRELILHAVGDLLQNARHQDHPLRLMLCEVVLEGADGRVDDGASSRQDPQLEGPFGDVPHGKEGEGAVARQRFALVVRTRRRESVAHLM